MAASRRPAPGPLSVDLPSPQPPLPSAASSGDGPAMVGPPPPPPDTPPVAALFLIDFDVKAGYTIGWQRAVPGVELEGLVEYKSLPSGLHTVADDLIYFVQHSPSRSRQDAKNKGSSAAAAPPSVGHAGLSAFVNVPCEDEGARHARMIAVGVLVPLTYGRLGRAWRHAQALKQLAARLAQDGKDTAALERYWEQHHLRGPPAFEPLTTETPLGSPSVSTYSLRRPPRGHARNRSASDGAALLPPGQRLSPYHPAWSLTALLDAFGPLIFPIHRAALLRKRILISCHAPVQQVCNFVYDISILSNIPASVAEVLPEPAPTQRLRPLFCVGVHDIPFLMEDLEASRRKNGAVAAVADDTESSTVADETGDGWIACTTDSILAMKDTLWDVLITMPPPYASSARERTWPTVEHPKGVRVKASQRDRRRYLALRSGLARMMPKPSLAVAASGTTGPTAVDRSPAVAEGGSDAFRLSTAVSGALAGPRREEEAGDESLDGIVEASSWAALAYSGFMWWASAGEQGRSDEADEAARDAALLADLDVASPGQRRRRMSSSMAMPGHGAAAPGVTATTTALAGPGNGSTASLTARGRGGAGGAGGDENEAGEMEEARTELAMIAYFHRLTTQMLVALGEVAEAAAEDSGDDEEGEDEDPLLPPGLTAVEEPAERPVVSVGSRVVEYMGLDVWNGADARFVEELADVYFGRRAKVEGKGVEVCGVRIC